MTGGSSARLGLADGPRPGVKETMQRLRDLGIRHLVMLTGDNEAAAHSIAQQVGVTDVRGELLPEHKVDAVRDLKAEYGDVAMTGDGVNDTPVLAQATVGIAMGAAPPSCRSTADIALMADDSPSSPLRWG